MSRSMELLIDHPDERQLLVLLGASVHQAPCATGEGTWEVHLADELVGHLGRAPEIDGVAFLRFPWRVQVCVDQQGSLNDHPATVALRMVADDLRTAGCRVLLVHDLHHRAVGAAMPGRQQTDASQADGGAHPEPHEGEVPVPSPPVPLDREGSGG